MTPICSRCKQTIPVEDINVATDVAVCRRCNLVHKLSEMVSGTALDSNVDVTRPPEGTWFRGSGVGAIIGASHRSIGMALGTLALALFWNGIVSVFVCLALSSTLNLLHVPTPEWFPAPKMNGTGMGVGMTLFLWLFLTPFILIGLAFIGAFFSALGGRTEASIRSGEGIIFTGIGPLGWRRRFNPELVKTVRIDDKTWRNSDGNAQRKTEIVIETEAGKVIRFGSTLKPERMKFVAAALRRVLVEKKTL